jgi:superfamily II DNA or RNA helicase
LAAPEPGQLVEVRDRRWVVGDVHRSAQPETADAMEGQHLLRLVSVEDDAPGEELSVVWELEPGRRRIDEAELPTPQGGNFDEPGRLEAFLDAVRWGAVTSADSHELQAPFRAGISIEDYQLDPAVRALRMPRANLLVADDVGLGKTIEAGLVIQELLLRHRARTVLVVCPASLQLKWRDEMAEKFGLEFRIVDAELLRDLRRNRGLYANPWAHYPRLITSIDWLKRDRPMQLMRDVLPSHPTYPRRFDLLVVDEVQTAAPSGRGRYATDSQRTKALRTIGPHFEHRLFLSATPHNGYQESFTALLELLDDQRFAREVPPSREQLARVMVRRLKSELPPHPDGTPRYPERKIIHLEVGYTDEERRIHAALREYAESRAKAAEHARGKAGRAAAEFVLTLLKKRLFSSPAAFAHTLAQHRATLAQPARGLADPPSDKVLASARDELESDFEDEDSLEEAWSDAYAAAERFTAPLSDHEEALLEEMAAWAERARDRGDTKSDLLVDWVEEVVRPGGVWSDERVIIFTEYRHTQQWLQERLVARGLGGDRLALLFGGMDTDERETIKAHFQHDPAGSPVRILLATDAASEGIDLQRHCHRMVHVEIPWNPNRLEQRIGRIDRHGQPSPEVLVHHFVGAGWQHAQPGSLESDLHFLHVAAEKVEAIRDDLGNVGPVIADQVAEAMTGRRHTLETGDTEQRSPQRRVLKLERDLREETARLRQQLDASIDKLNLTPATIERVVRVGLAVARQPGLTPADLDRGDGREYSGLVFGMPQLTGSWALASVGLEHPVTGQRRPITFAHEIAAGHDDVVLVHLGHRLVQQCLRLLRAEIWAAGPQANLARVTARLVPDDALDHLAVIAHGRLVITGADGHRLHEEVIAAGGRVRSARFARFNVGETDAAIAAATTDAPPAERLADLEALWPDCEGPLRTALDYRARTRAEALATHLDKRADEEVRAITAVLEELRQRIEDELAEPDLEQLQLFTPDERAQYDRDLDALRHRLDQIPEELDQETQAIRRRYETTKPRHFPAAVTFLIPRRLADMPLR